MEPACTRAIRLYPVKQLKPKESVASETEADGTRFIIMQNVLQL